MVRIHGVQRGFLSETLEQNLISDLVSGFSRYSGLLSKEPISYFS